MPGEAFPFGIMTLSRMRRPTGVPIKGGVNSPPGAVRRPKPGRNARGRFLDVIS